MGGTRRKVGVACGILVRLVFRASVSVSSVLIISFGLVVYYVYTLSPTPPPAKSKQGFSSLFLSLATAPYAGICICLYAKHLLM